MSYPSKEEVLEALQSEGFLKSETPKWSNADEVWTHDSAASKPQIS